MAVVDGRREIPDGPVDFDEVVRRWPTVRQSLLADFDDCELSAFFRLKYEKGWSSQEQARGTMFHRVAAECLREMQRNDSTHVPVGVALAILEEQLYQHGVDPKDIVRVPLRQLPDLEMAVRKFARDNKFSIRNVIDVERRLEAPITYQREDGELVERVLTGQLDALIARPPDEAIVIDWKTTWALPPKRDENAEDPGVSYHGFFQQQFYAWLVMKCFPEIQAVSLREFYVYRTEARPARVTREDLPVIEQRLRYLVAAFDRAVASGAPRKYALKDLEEQGSWKPSPGHHCGWCIKSHYCPLDDDVKPGSMNAQEAARLAAARQVMKASAKRIDALLRPFAEQNGPIPLKWSKGRRVLGFRKIKGGVRWEEFTPGTADRPTTEDATDLNLAAAMRDASERAKEGRS